MRRVRVNAATEITVKGIQGFIERTVTNFGSGAKVDCPKEYLGRMMTVAMLLTILSFNIK